MNIVYPLGMDHRVEEQVLKYPSFKIHQKN